MRLAHAHGLKVQTFSRLLGGSDYAVWNRDIDRGAPPWLIEILCRNTATPAEAVRGTTLRAYEGEIYTAFHDSYVLPWVLTLQIRRFSRLGFGMQFCPRCLAEDAEPYYRKRWRIAFCTWCSIHDVMLHDRCPSCQAPVIFHRRELGHPKEIDGGSLAQCHACAFDLRQASATAPQFYEPSARVAFEQAVGWLEGRSVWMGPERVDYFGVLHHLCRTMLAAYRAVHLRQYACGRVGIEDLPFKQRTRVLEQRSVVERHHLVQLAFWFLADPRNRLTAAWQDGAVTYSALLRDFDDRPKWYDEIVEGLADWRRRPTRHVQPKGSDGRFLPVSHRYLRLP